MPGIGIETTIYAGERDNNIIYVVSLYHYDLIMCEIKCGLLNRELIFSIIGYHLPYVSIHS